ncbi:MAG TPA: hypothetical protein VFS82_10295 [Lysobacter sp.]|nr:hypothetical protein [Lysobacter sp.]
MSDIFSSLALHSGSGTCSRVTLKYTCINAAIANGSTSAAFRPQTVTAASANVQNPAMPGNRLASAATGANTRMKITSVSSHTMTVTKIAFFSIVL